MAPPRDGRSKPSSLLVFALIGLGTVPARWAAAAVSTSPPELGLVWRAPDGCPSAAALEAEVVRLLGGPDRVVSSKRINAEAAVRRIGASKWTIQLDTEVDGMRGHRSLEGENCRSVAAAAALVLALTIDPTAARRAVAPSPLSSSPASPSSSTSTRPSGSPTASPVAAASPPAAPATSTPAPAPAAPSPPTPPPAPPAPADNQPQPAGEPNAETAAQPSISKLITPTPQETTPSAFRPFVRTFGGGALALLPEPAAVAGLALGVRHGRLDVELSGLVSQQRRAQAAERPSAGGNFRLLAVGARGCGQLGERWIITRLCGGLEIERLSAQASGVEMPGWGAATLAAGVVTGVLALPLGNRLEATLEIAASARPYHPSFVLTNLGPVFAVPAVAAVGTLGLTVKL